MILFTSGAASTLFVNRKEVIEALISCSYINRQMASTSILAIIFEVALGLPPAELNASRLPGQFSCNHSIH